ncbi:hypothetical protein FA15DRAFT_658990 [Coprinopsis marcescibilis]|uniref:Uncharacterized protein n=1 Tax=Coprinopsis marcescibilis TaxID=230819 RepID=A0A5C3KK30_COPMA|nr:hypothetical protein FA15DRAFT_658990 [Coprinopsis marcescibilis]
MSTPASPGKTNRWSRMGAAVRRSTSLLAPSRPTTPGNNQERDSDSTSITKQKVDTSPAVLAPPHLASAMHSVSPISESPQREAQAIEESAPLGPSPLARDASGQPSSHANQPASDADVASPQDYVPPPLIDSKAGNPGAFTDEPDSLPQPQVAQDPFASSSRVDLGQYDGNNQGAQIMDEPEEYVEEPSRLEEPTPQVEEPRSFFDKPVVSDYDDDENTDFAAAVEHRAAISPPVISESPKFVPQVIAPQVENVDSYDLPMPLPSHHEADSATAPIKAEPVYSAPAFDYNLGHEVWGGKVDHAVASRGMLVPSQARNGNASLHHTTVPVDRAPSNDPFLVSAPPKLAISRSHHDNIHMPKPQLTPQHEQPPVLSHEDATGTVIMPLPAFQDVIPTRSDLRTIHPKASTSSFMFDRAPAHTDETQPLLAAGSSKNLYTQPVPNIIDISHSTNGHANGNRTSWVPDISGSTGSRLHELGWLEYHLPDGTFYYVHPTKRITTDLNLRQDKSLSDVTNFLENSSTGFGGGSRFSNGKEGPGIEVWLRDLGSAKKGFVPVKCYVDHHSRTVTVDRVEETGRGSRKVIEEDQLDMEFRYWSFMEAHPAHTTLPAKAKAEAMDVLTWAWTDRLLPSHRAIPAPFTQDECQELMTLIRNFNGDHDDHGIQNRVVSRLLLRVALWRQKYFRPNKPLPKDVSSDRLHLPTLRRPLRRAFLDIIISCVCLGIPYLFLERSRLGNGRFDEESGTLGRSAGPVFIIGACTCLVAAIVLSAAVTFLSLPGLDHIARTAGLVAILFASFAMASTLVAIFKYKNDLERSVSFVGLEGLMNISKRAVVLSLPLVFLAYSIIGFVTAITLYSLNGVAANDPSLILEPFEDYTRWTVIGLVGALGGIFATTYIVARSN